MSSRKRGKGQAAARRARQAVQAESYRRVTGLRDMLILQGQFPTPAPTPELVDAAVVVQDFLELPPIDG